MSIASISVGFGRFHRRLHGWSTHLVYMAKLVRSDGIYPTQLLICLEICISIYRNYHEYTRDVSADPNLFAICRVNHPSNFGISSEYGWLRLYIIMWIYLWYYSCNHIETIIRDLLRFRWPNRWQIPQGEIEYNLWRKSQNEIPEITECLRLSSISVDLLRFS